MAAHKCKSCACRQNGTLVCANDTNNPACGSFSFNKPVKRHPYSSLAPFVRRNNGASDAADKGLSLPSTQFSSYAECVRAHNGQSSFKQDCNSCACTKSGAVICTLMACPPSPLPTSSAPTEPTGTIVGSGTCTATSTSQSGSYAYQSYDQCVSANGGAHFKRECNFCSCISDGKVACTKMACPSTCH
ncbi:hypothetical protein LPJ56_006526 [Coemansia sp. RSA 2599]|nr:hypothetical protein LPJ56_006526 [Coemansia sp. RSA 2599]